MLGPPLSARAAAILRRAAAYFAKDALPKG
jgi:hypothetical protein